MKNTKTPKQQPKSTPVIPVVKETESGCSCGCTRDNSLLKTVLLAGSIWGSALVIAMAIVSADTTSKITPVKPVVNPVQRAVTTEANFKKFVENNPQLIMDVINKHIAAENKKAAAAEAEATQPKTAPQALIDEIVTDKSNYSLGNPEGKFVIIEFFDYQCGWCKRTNAALEEALAKPEAKNIRWIPIDTPIFGEKSQMIARFVLAAGKQGKYKEMHEEVGVAKALNEEAFVAIGKKLGLDTDKLIADANSDEIKAKLETNKKYSKELNINGVPMLIVNGKLNPGALLGERLDAAIKESQEVK